MIDIIVQTLVSGIFTGALYGLAAVGLSLVFGVMRILNVAHGELLMVGGYVGFYLFTLYGIDPFLGLPLAAIAVFLIGMVLYKLLFSRTIKFHEELKLKNSLLIGFGLVLIFHQVGHLLFTTDERAIAPFYAGSAFEVLGIRFAYIPLGGLIVALVVVLALHLLLSKTYFGKSVRATAQDWEAAILMGINIDRTYLLSFALAAAIAAIAGPLLAASQAITPCIGLPWTMKALIVVVLAGMGRVGGAFFAGLLLGVVESVSAIFIGPYVMVVGLVMFLLIMMFRPQGLFQRR